MEVATDILNGLVQRLDVHATDNMINPDDIATRERNEAGEADIVVDNQVIEMQSDEIQMMEPTEKLLAAGDVQEGTVLKEESIMTEPVVPSPRAGNGSAPAQAEPIEATIEKKECDALGKSDITIATHESNGSVVESIIANTTLITEATNVSGETHTSPDTPTKRTLSHENDGPHDEKDSTLSTRAGMVTSVPHHDDEYDPVNPSRAFEKHRPAAEQEEYDPDHPSMTLSEVAEADVVMKDTDALFRNRQNDLSTMKPAKRKESDKSHETTDNAANADSHSKRPRRDDDNKRSVHRDDFHSGRPRRESGDSISPSKSRLRHQKEDHKGLSAAAWDRLMDFQTSGEFLVTQVSRAAFASVGAMPEFAQIAIIARFVRTPMQDVRDKNGQLMRLFREYQKENPQIATLQPVEVFLSDYKSDSSLFRFGYAPPQPTTGMSTVPVPYQRDQSKVETVTKHSPRQAKSLSSRSDSERHFHKDVDEFGRVVHPASGPFEANTRSASDHHLATPSRPESSTANKAMAVESHDQPPSHSNIGAGRDPRRRGTLTAPKSPLRGGYNESPRDTGLPDLYKRLPVPVQAVIDSMRREGRLQEPLNDNVITRLLHLPERVALQAVENFSNVDLSQVENLQGFLVGIINRVNEKAIASEKQPRPQMLSPRKQASKMPRSGGYGAPSFGASVLGGPPPGGRMNNLNGNGYQPAPVAAGTGPALYDRPSEAPQDPRRRQAAPQDPHMFNAVPQGISSVNEGRAPMAMQSFTALPISVQNHIHSLVANQTLLSLEELGGKCYEVLGQLSEPLANQVLTRFAGANLSNVRNKSGFLIGVVKRARQEYGFN